MKIISITAVLLATFTIAGCSNDITRAATSLSPEYLDLSPDEQLIWRDLSAAQRARAIQFIQADSTLIASLGDK